MVVLESKSFTEILKDEEFLKKVISASNAQEVKLLFSERGVILSDDEINKVGEIVKNILYNSDIQLDNVVGGVDVSNKIRNISCAIAAICLAGSAIYASRKFGKVADTANDKVESVKPTGLGSWLWKICKNK